VANDAERVQIRAQYSCVLVVFILISIAVEQLSPDSFPDQTETQRARFFGNGSLPCQACPIGKPRVTISVSFALL
jgi:hypothetical protein